MNIKKFIAANTVEAMRLVKKTLGSDAIIISNKPINGGVEIIAMNNYELETLNSKDIVPKLIEKESTSVEENENSNEDFCIDDFCSEITLGETKKDNKKKQLQQASEISKKDIEEVSVSVPNQKPRKTANHDNIFPVVSDKVDIDNTVKKEVSINESKLLENSQAQTLFEKHINEEVISNESTVDDRKIPTEVLIELRSLRKVMDSHLNKLNLGKEVELKVNILKKLLTVGFSPVLAKNLIADLPKNCDMINAESFIRTKASSMIKSVRVSDEIIMQGGVYALVGPTGVGKTTTAAKIAAKAVEKFGINDVALITTDTYRIAATEQLKIYGKLLKIPVTVIKDIKLLSKTVLKVKQEKRLVIIDTVGLSQKDQRINSMLETINLIDGIKKILLLPSNAKIDALDEIIKIYSQFSLDGCILTKEDEAIGMASSLDAIIRSSLVLHYVCNGQRVPEDICFPNKKSLIVKAFNEINEGPNSYLSNLDIAILMSEFDYSED